MKKRSHNLKLLNLLQIDQGREEIRQKFDQINNRVDQVLKKPSVLPARVFTGKGHPASSDSYDYTYLSSFPECVKKCEKLHASDSTYNVMLWALHILDCRCYKNSRGFAPDSVSDDSSSDEWIYFQIVQQSNYSYLIRILIIENCAKIYAIF